MSGRTPTPAARGRDLDVLVEEVLARRPRALGRAVTLVETGGEERRELVRRLFPRTGHARVVGVTGPPGAGKSTLVDRLAKSFRERQETVGILAVDPTSPFSGGAILGDRIRMQELYTDEDVFIRSMATRGALGGLARATHDALDVLDAAGFDRVLVETVGVGQDEVDVVRSVDTVVVATVPGLGDEIQAIKAGILEIADIFVLNKADREGAERTYKDLRLLLSMVENPTWRPPIVRAVATRGEGIEELVTQVERHREWLEESGELERRRRAHLRQRVEEILQRRVLEDAETVAGLGEAIDGAFAAREDPYAVADRLYADVKQA
ncbi:MAG: methylmalonyl Co-A mutase-associated GTPase MeaB [Thermoanaerobaculia bacterium]